MKDSTEKVLPEERAKTQTQIAIRENLARLLSAENITVTHGNISTAGFDVKNRRLLLPNWNCSRDLYTTLITHEVGHALHTPADIPSKFLKDNYLKNIVNCIEDVRIEKLMLKKFPGFRGDFYRGYAEMQERDFFGLASSGKRLKDYGFMDRVNLRYKLGRYTDFQVPFSPVEKVWCDRVDECVTFQDVLDLAEELHEFEKEQAKKKQQQQSSNGNQDSNGDNNSGQQSQPGDQEQASGGGSDSDGVGDQDSTGQDVQPQHGQSREGQGPGDLETQTSLSRALGDLTDGAGEPQYINLPKTLDTSSIIIDYKHILAKHKRFYNKDENLPLLELGKRMYEEFNRDNKKIISNMINIFNMKKSAQTRVRTKIKKTGDLNMSRLHRYRYSEDIFKRRRNSPEGKNHGLVMFLDQSGSMSNTMPGAIDQILLLSRFCRKLNIPFDVYGFRNGNSFKSKKVEEEVSGTPDEFANTDDFHLNQYLSSSMNNFEYEQACQHLTCIKIFFLYRYMSWRDMPDDIKQLSNINLHRADNLHSTPLNETIVSAAYILKEFKAKHKCSIVNTIFVTDGDNTNELCKMGESYYGYGKYSCRPRKTNYIKDATGRSWVVNNTETAFGYEITCGLLQILKGITGCNTIGFFLNDRFGIEYMLSERANIPKEQIQNTLDRNGFVEVLKEGYDAYYYIPNGENLNVNSENSLNNNKNNAKQRVFLNRFIEQIA